jgi:hypothetical protein
MWRKSMLDLDLLLRELVLQQLPEAVGGDEILPP